MESSLLVKLLILVLVTLVLCLPELFPPYQDKERIDFTCMRFQPCPKQMLCDTNTDEMGDGNLCVGCTNSSMGEPPGITSRSTNASGGPGLGWFRCETTADLGTINWTGVDVELSVLQSWHHKQHNTTLLGFVESCEQVAGNQRPLFCCVGDPASTFNRSHCILCAWSFESASVNATLLWMRTQHGFFWSCSYRLAWLTTVITVILLVISATTRRVLEKRFRKMRTAVLPITAYQLSPALSGPASCPDAQSGPPTRLVHATSPAALSTIYEAEETEGNYTEQRCYGQGPEPSAGV